jgi:intracellular septation protein A
MRRKKGDEHFDPDDAPPRQAAWKKSVFVAMMAMAFIEVHCNMGEGMWTDIRNWGATSGIFLAISLSANFGAT